MEDLNDKVLISVHTIQFKVFKVRFCVPGFCILWRISNCTVVYLFICCFVRLSPCPMSLHIKEGYCRWRVRYSCLSAGLHYTHCVPFPWCNPCLTSRARWTNTKETSQSTTVALKVSVCRAWNALSKDHIPQFVLYIHGLSRRLPLVGPISWGGPGAASWCGVIGWGHPNASYLIAPNGRLGNY